MKKILFSDDSECLSDLHEMVRRQDHRTSILWALENSMPFVGIFEKYHPEDGRPRTAVTIAREWSQGKVKMPVAKKAIHSAHNAASESGIPAAEAAARTAGHAAATVHVKTHAMGLVYYGLTAIVRSSPGNANKKVDDMIDELTKRLEYWSSFDGKDDLQWADFILRNDSKKP